MTEGFQLLLMSLIVAVTKSADITLQCGFKTETYDYIGKIYQCEPSDFVVTSRNDEIHEVVGTHLSDYEVSDVRGLFVNEETCNYLPVGLNKFFKELEVLRIHNSELLELRKVDLQSMPKLKWLQMFKNKLEILGKNLFAKNPLLVYIDFDCNNLKHIDADILSSLASLQSAEFKHNQCIDRDSSDADELRKVFIQSCQDPNHINDPEEEENKELLEFKKQVDDKFNRQQRQIEALSVAFYETTKRLRKLEMENEKIMANAAEIDVLCEAFAGKCNVDELLVLNDDAVIKSVSNIDGNEVKYSSIAELTIVNQTTFFLPTNIAQTFPNLKSLSVTKSSLMEVAKGNFKYMKSINYLSLSGNKLSEIPTDSFADLAELETLDLSENVIRNIAHKAFNGLRKLHELNLNGNQLQDLNSKCFINIRELKVLRINDNRIKSISSNVVNVLPKLRVFDLRNNVCINSSLPANKTSLSKLSKEIQDKCPQPTSLCCRLVSSHDKQSTCR